MTVFGRGDALRPSKASPRPSLAKTGTVQGLTRHGPPEAPTRQAPLRSVRRADGEDPALFCPHPLVGSGLSGSSLGADHANRITATRSGRQGRQWPEAMPRCARHPCQSEHGGILPHDRIEGEALQQQSRAKRDRFPLCRICALTYTQPLWIAGRLKNLSEREGFRVCVLDFSCISMAYSQKAPRYHEESAAIPRVRAPRYHELIHRPVEENSPLGFRVRDLRDSLDSWERSSNWTC